MTETIKITLEQAKGICSDFKIVQRKDLGKKACLHLLPDQEMCRRGDHFVCELVLYKIRGLAKGDRAEQPAYTAGSIDLLDTCARKYSLVLEKKLSSPAGEPVFLRVLDAFQRARAKIDLGHTLEMRDVGDALPPVEAAKLRAAIRLYLELAPYPVGSVTCEEFCQFEFEGSWFTGTARALTQDGSTVIDWRYAQNAVSALQVTRRAAIFLHGFRSAERYALYRLRKPAYRPKKHETMRDFEQRIVEGMRKEPSKVWTRTIIERDHLDVEGVLREMQRTHRIVLPALREAGMPPNYASCETCDYQTVCAENLGATTDEIARQLKEPA